MFVAVYRSMGQHIADKGMRWLATSIPGGPAQHFCSQSRFLRDRRWVLLILSSSFTSLRFLED